MTGRGYDPACADLARHFLGDMATANNPRLVRELAQAIQDEIETWLACEAERIAAEIERGRTTQ